MRNRVVKKEPETTKEKDEEGTALFMGIVYNSVQRPFREPESAGW